MGVVGWCEGKGDLVRLLLPLASRICITLDPSDGFLVQAPPAGPGKTIKWQARLAAASSASDRHGRGCQARQLRGNASAVDEAIAA